MSFPMRYGSPKAAAMKNRNGFLLGFGAVDGDPSGSSFRPSKEAKALGVSAVASAGGGRPVIFANSVLSHLNTVNIPNIDPSVFRRLPNCSATETIANSGQL